MYKIAKISKAQSFSISSLTCPHVASGTLGCQSPILSAGIVVPTTRHTLPATPQTLWSPWRQSVEDSNDPPEQPHGRVDHLEAFVDNRLEASNESNCPGEIKRKMVKSFIPSDL